MRPDEDRDFGTDIGNELTALTVKPMETQGVDGEEDEDEDDDDEVFGEMDGDVRVDSEVVVVAGEGRGVRSKCIS